MDDTTVDFVAIAERVRKRIAAAEIEIDGATLAVTASFGIVELTRVGEASAEDFLATADEALYEAKRTGRNRVVTASFQAS